MMLRDGVVANQLVEGGRNFGFCFASHENVCYASRTPARCSLGLAWARLDQENMGHTMHLQRIVTCFFYSPSGIHF